MEKMKSVLSVLFAAVMTLTLFAAGAAAVDFVGDGTPDSPLQIGTEEQLLEFAVRVKQDGTGLCAVLTENITVDGEWEAIGHPMTGANNAQWILESAAPYVGTFDGGGHTLTLSKTGIAGAKENVGVALFHTVGTGGVIRNVNLNVSFEGRRYIAGAAVYNYGTIEYVTVEGTITAGVDATTNAAGIVAYNGCKTVDGVLIPGKIFHCVNKAEISVDSMWASGVFADVEKWGGESVGGICANFLGEMRYCANLGDVWLLGNGGASPVGGSLFGIRAGLGTNPTQTLIVSDCYNAGTVYIISSTSPSFTYGGLFGVANETNIFSWILSDKVKISDTFNYGLVRNPYPDLSPSNVDGTHIIIGFGNTAAFNDSYINYMFSNIYYRPEIGGRLFGQYASNNGADGKGTPTTKQRIIGKTAAEFATAALAAALNNGRTGTEAPWEYVEGKDYPTLKFERADYDPAVDSTDVVSEETAQKIGDIVESTTFTTDETMRYVRPKAILAYNDNDLSAIPTGGADSVVSRSDLERGGENENRVYVSPDKITELAAGDESLNKRVNSAAGILSTPVAEVTVGKGQTALFSYSMDLSRFAGARIGDLTFMKVTPQGLRLPWKVSGFADLADERYIITNEEGAVIEDSEVITGSKNYILTVGVKDDGRYDWDTTDGHIIDPYAVGAPDGGSDSAPSGGGGGGCDAGAAGFAPLGLALLAMFAARKKMR